MNTDKKFNQVIDELNRFNKVVKTAIYNGLRDDLNFTDESLYLSATLNPKTNSIVADLIIDEIFTQTKNKSLYGWFQCFYER